MSWTFTRSKHWQVFLEINLNQRTLKLYTSQLNWKNQCRLTIRKYANLWKKHKYQHSVDMFVTNIFNSFHMTLASFYTPWNTSEKRRFPNVFWGHRKTPVSWNGLKVIVNFPHVLLMANNIDKIAFILFNISSGFFIQFEVCIIYCFYA